MKFTFIFILVMWLSNADAASSFYSVSVGDTLAPVQDSALYLKGKKQRVASRVLFISGGTLSLIGLLVGWEDLLSTSLTSTETTQASKTAAVFAITGIAVIMVAITLTILARKNIKRSRQAQNINFIAPPVIGGAPRQNGVGVALSFGNRKR